PTSPTLFPYTTLFRSRAVPPERRQRVGHDARRAAGVVDRQEASAEPFDLLRQRRLEPGTLPGVEALLRHGADGRRPETAHGHERSEEHTSELQSRSDL